MSERASSAAAGAAGALGAALFAAGTTPRVRRVPRLLAAVSVTVSVGVGSAGCPLLGGDIPCRTSEDCPRGRPTCGAGGVCLVDAPGPTCPERFSLADVFGGEQGASCVQYERYDGVSFAPMDAFDALAQKWTCTEGLKCALQRTDNLNGKDEVFTMSPGGNDAAEFPSPVLSFPTSAALPPPILIVRATTPHDVLEPAMTSVDFRAWVDGEVVASTGVMSEERPFATVELVLPDSARGKAVRIEQYSRGYSADGSYIEHFELDQTRAPVAVGARAAVGAFSVTDDWFVADKRLIPRFAAGGDIEELAVEGDCIETVTDVTHVYCASFFEGRFLLQRRLLVAAADDDGGGGAGAPPIETLAEHFDDANGGGVFLADDFVYFLTGRALLRISRASIDAGAPDVDVLFDRPVIDSELIDELSSPRVARDQLFVLNGRRGSLYRVSLAPATDPTPVRIADTGDGADFLELDATHAWWGAQGANLSVLVRTPLDADPATLGENAEVVADVGGNGAVGLALDERYLYYSDAAAKAVIRIDRATLAAETFAAGFSGPGSLAVHGAYLYVADTAAGRIFRVRR